jgi:hypothetical protein
LIIWKRRGPLRIAHAFFSFPPGLPDCDILRLRQVPTPMEGDGWSCSPFTTLHLDLRKSEEELMGELHSDTAYKVRRAIKRDSLECFQEPEPDSACVNRLLNFHDVATADKGLPVRDRDFFEQLRAAGALRVSWLTSPDSGELAYRAHMVAEGRTRLIISAIRSDLRVEGSGPFLGRANRLLVWRDICSFRDAGVVCYDFGGIYQGNDRPDLRRIATFKLGFGGRVVEEYKCVRAVTLLGRLALRVAGALGR